MGEIADKMINGELCEWCGVYLAPEEHIYYPKGEESDSYLLSKMPKNGTGFGTPVICADCYADRDE